MKKKAISLLLVAAMTATMTAGCGDKQEAADNTLQETMRHLLQKQQHLMMQQQKKKRKHGAVH